MSGPTKLEMDRFEAIVVKVSELYLTAPVEHIPGRLARWRARNARWTQIVLVPPETGTSWRVEWTTADGTRLVGDNAYERASNEP